MLIRLSSPSGVAVPLASLKQSLRVDFDTDDDVLTSLLKAETARYEDLTGRFMLPIDLEYRTDCWRYPIEVPALPLRSVAQVSYLDENNAEQVLSASLWYEIVTDRGVEIHFTDDFGSPTLSDRPQAVRVQLSAGYDETGASGSGDDPELDPQDADLNLLKLMVARTYDSGVPIPEDELRRMAGHRRIFR